MQDVSVTGCTARPRNEAQVMPRATVTWTDLGRLRYAEAWSLQRSIVERRKAGEGTDRLLLVEHDPVITMGRNAAEEHLLVGREGLADRSIEVHVVERGGDVTYHGPGQLVGYPILDLRDHRKDVRWYSRSLADVMIEALRRLGIDARAGEGSETGVWLAEDRSRAKIGMLGVRVERWITYHGFALNVAPDLAPFQFIVPCGLRGVAITSAREALGRPVPMALAREAVLGAFADVFEVELRRADANGLEAAA
jgi:lipoate-protein ligase B